MTSVTDELGRKTEFTYDGRDLQTSITDPLNHTSTTSYDAVGNAIALTDPLGNKTTYGYDKIYRLTNQTDAENRTTNYQFDPVGNLISLTDPEDNTTTYTHDELNCLLTDTNQLGDTRTYEYDAVGNQIASVDRNGREINYLFDNLNRNTKEIWLDNAGNPVHTFDFQYDVASQLLNAHDPNSAYSYKYDLDGRITSVDNAGTPNVPNVVLNYGYDAVDNLTQVNDSIGGVDQGVENFTYDQLDRVTKITQSGDGVSDKRVDYTYDQASQMTGMSRYSDLTGNNLIAQSTYTFDENGRLTNLTHDQDGNVLSAYDWAYDQANRITQATSPDGVSDYDYDKSDQLVDADHSYQDDEAYSYDDNGNRVNAGYVTGENNQLTSDGTYNYQYDKEGNRVKRTEIATGEVTEYEWDYRNRLVGVETKNSDGNITANADYTYDVFDNRIAKSVDADGVGAGEAVVERFVYDGDHIALTFNGEGNQTERFLHGTQIDQVLAQENESGEVLWALADNQGSVRVLLDNDGNVVNNITYDAFGNVTVESNPDVNFRFSYTGREFDSETGLYNYRSRYYDPGVGEFVSEDRIGFAGGDSNLYRYVHNNPINRIDPTGKSDVRWPFNASLKNNSDQDVYILNSSEKEDRIEVLHPGNSTPDSPGRSKDPDGVWINDNGWKFYPLRYAPYGLPPNSLPNGDGVVNSDNKVRSSYEKNPDATITGNHEPLTVFIKPWDGNPNSADRPGKRGREDGIGIYPPDTRITYPDASQWEPVAPENAKTRKNLGQNGLERLINFGDDSLQKLEDKILKDRNKENSKENKQKENKKGNVC